MNARSRAAAILLLGLGSLSPIRADDAPGAPAIVVPDPAPYLDAAGAAVVGASRDGSKVFFTRRVSGIVQLFVTDADGKSPRQLTARPQSLSFAVPSPDGSKVILGYDKDGDENTGLFVVETAVDKRAASEIEASGAVQRGSVVWTPESDRIFYRANGADPASFHIYSSTIDPPRQGEAVFAASGSWRVEDVARGGERLLLVRERSNRDASLFHFHVKSHSLTEIHPQLSGTTSAVGKARFVGTGSNVVFTQEYPEEYPYTHVEAWMYDFATGAARRTPAQGEDTRHGCIVFEGDIEDLAVSTDGSRVYIRKNASDAPDQLAIADVATNEELGTLRCPPGVYSGLFVDESGRVFSSRSSPFEPGSVVRWDSIGATSTTIVLADVGTLLGDALPENPELVELESPDKTEFHAWLWLPRTKEAKGLPFILSIHGGPEGEDRPGWHADRAYLLSLGFGVLAPNVRGSTGRGRSFRDADDGAKRMDAVRDARVAADWLVEKGYADPKRLGVMGGSYGGFMVMALLTEFPDRFVAGAEAVGIVNFETFLEKTSSYRRALREAEYGSLSDRALLRSISPIHKLDRITAALLVAHGENDPRVPVGEARQIEAELKRLGRPVETLIFPDEGHGFRKPANRKKHLETLARFFLTHLAPP